MNVSTKIKNKFINIEVTLSMGRFAIRYFKDFFMAKSS
jgi:hypothetical protein